MKRYLTTSIAALLALLFCSTASAGVTYGDQRLAWKRPVEAVCTSNMDLSGTETCDGQSLTADDHALLTSQTTAAENGIYIVRSGTWVRRQDADRTGELEAGAAVYVQSGTVYAGTTWTLTTTGTVTIGTTSQTWAAAYPAARWRATEVAPVEAVCSSNMDLTGTETCDGSSLAAGDYALLVNQTSADENGIYLVSATAWSRRTDVDATGELFAGVNVYVQAGTVYAGTRWTLTTTGTITVDTTSQTWVADYLQTRWRGTELYPVEAVCTSNMDLAGDETCDGQSLTSGDYAVLVGQTSGDENGIYLVDTAWSRRTDADATGELFAGVNVYASAGTAYGGTRWTLTTTGTITVDTTSQTWALAEYTDGEVQIPLSAGTADGGTWTYAVAAGLETQTRTAADAADSLWVPIPLPSRTSTLQGIKPTSVTCNYNVDTADSEDIRTEVWLVTQGADGSAATAAVLFGEDNADYDDAHDTAAERGDDTGAPEHHKSVATDAGTPAYLAAGETLLLRLYVDGAAASVEVFTSCTLGYSATTTVR